MVGRQEAPSHNFFSMAYDHIYTRFAPLLLLIVGGLVYANSLSGDFIYDHIHSIVQNPDIRSLWPPHWLQPTDAAHRLLRCPGFCVRVAVAGPPAAHPVHQLYRPAARIAGQLVLSVGALRGDQRI